jgi:CheY-like chemotaxis protein
VPYTLLLADDSVTIQRVIELTFAEEDIQVTAVSDGEQAIQRLQAAPPDIVLADIGMPGRNGYEVAQFIKQSPSLAHIPVVLLTGAFEPVDHARASEAGCDGVLAKPFEPQLVIGRVKDLLARRRPAAAAAAEVSTAPPAAPSIENWVPPPVSATAPSASSPEPTTPIALDSYFDRLDAAFSNLSAAPAPAPAPPPPAPAAAPVVPDEIDWFGAAKSGTTAQSAELELPQPAMDERPDLPLSTFAAWEAEPETVPAAAPVIPAEEAPAPSAVVVEAPPAPVVAETSAPAIETPASVGETPAAPVVESPAPVAEVPAVVASAPVPQPLVPIHQVPTLADAFAVLLAAEKGEVIAAWPADDVVDQVTKRILAQLSERIVRETVADVVSSIAERLIREEIERIKAALQ